MLTAVDEFCALDDKLKEQFIACPQVNARAEAFFALAKAVDCKNKIDFQSYLKDGCDFICQGVKAKGFEKLTEANDTTTALFVQQISELDKSIDYWSVAVSMGTKLAETYSEYKEVIVKDNNKLLNY